MMTYSRTRILPFQLGNLLLVVAFIVLIIMMVVLLRRIFGASASTKRALEERDAIARLEITSADRETWIGKLRHRDPGFAVDPFLERVKSLFLDTQQAWSSGDLGPVRRFLSDATWLRFRVQLGLLHAQAVRDVTADMEVTGLELVGLEQNEWFDTLHVAVHARARDADVPVTWSEAKAYAAASHVRAISFTEVWSLVRKPGVRSNTESSLAARSCPSCGAPFEGGVTSTCTYCKAVVNSGAYDWVLAEITQATDVTRGEAPVPGLELMGRRDPGLSLEVLEDRASLVFWHWVEAQSSGEPERLARLAQPGPIARMRADISRLAQRREQRVFLECAVGAVLVRAFEDTAEGHTLAHVEIRWSSRTGVGPVGRPPPLLPVLPQRWVLPFSELRTPSAVPSRVCPPTAVHSAEARSGTNSPRIALGVRRSSKVTCAIGRSQRPVRWRPGLVAHRQNPWARASQSCKTSRSVSGCSTRWPPWP